MIFENEDELGYWVEGAQPSPFAAISSLIVCNSLLTMQERADIEAAAINAHEGHDRDAERCRKYAGYDDLGFRRDADGPLLDSRRFRR